MTHVCYPKFYYVFFLRPAGVRFISFSLFYYVVFCITANVITADVLMHRRYNRQWIVGRFLFILHYIGNFLYFLNRKTRYLSNNIEG